MDFVLYHGNDRSRLVRSYTTSGEQELQTYTPQISRVILLLFYRCQTILSVKFNRVETFYDDGTLPFIIIDFRGLGDKEFLVHRVVNRQFLRLRVDPCYRVRTIRL